MKKIEFPPPEADLFVECNQAGHTMHALPQQGVLEFMLEGGHWVVNRGV